jgi:hypothetical protein
MTVQIHASARGQIQLKHGVGVGAVLAPYFPPEMNRAEVEWFSFVLLDCTDALLSGNYVENVLHRCSLNRDHSTIHHQLGAGHKAAVI